MKFSGQRAAVGIDVFPAPGQPSDTKFSGHRAPVGIDVFPPSGQPSALVSFQRWAVDLAS
jgi:hypothetical protein